jgi:PAS domain S-box-containing protein
MPEIDGLKLVQQIQLLTDTPIIMYTGQGSDEVAEQAFSNGVTDYIQKEIHCAHYKVLAKRIRLVVERERTEKALEDSEKRFKALIENSTDQREQLLTVQSSEERYRRLLNASFDGMILISGTKIVYANTSSAKLLGYDDPSELINLDISVTLPEEEYSRIKPRTLRRQRGEAVPARYELKLRRKDGRIIEAETATTLVEFDGGSAVLAVTRDITEAKRNEGQMIALRDHAYLLSETSTLDEVCQVTLDIVEQVIGFQLGSFLIVKEKELVAIARRGSSTLKIPIPIEGRGITAKAAREKRSQLVNDVRDDPNFLRGTTDSLSELAVPVILDGVTVAVLNFESLDLDAFDDADQKLLETFAVHVSSSIYRIRQMERVKDQEKEKSKALMDGANKLVSMVRHDLRSPLQTIQSVSYLMRRKLTGAEEYSLKLDASVEYAMRILDDLNVITGPIKLDKTIIDLNELMRDFLTNSDFASTIAIDVSYCEPLLIAVDSYKLRRVFDNFLKNAVESMPNGGTLSIKIESDEGLVTLRFKDTGQGIPEDVAEKLFTPFYTTKPNGTGLGLAICKQIIEAHGGRIQFYSALGEGTTFTIILPK